MQEHATVAFQPGSDREIIRFSYRCSRKEGIRRDNEKFSVRTPTGRWCSDERENEAIKNKHKQTENILNSGNCQ